MTRLSLLMLCVALGSTAQAHVSISNKPTQNMSCVFGVCTAIAQKAVLNVNYAATMLGSGDLTIRTGSVAKDINIDQPLTWTSTSRLRLDAQQSITIKKPVTVMGTGNLTITTNDGGKHGEFIIVPEHGSVQLWDKNSSLIIDGQSYTLVYDIKTLAADIAANPSGFYALAKSYDATVDGTYTSSPISTEFTGVFEGLGNTITNLKMSFTVKDANGLFLRVGEGGLLRDIGLTNVAVSGQYFYVGALAGGDVGTIERSWVRGTLNFPNQIGHAVGGLVGSTALHKGVVRESFADVSIYIGDFGHNGGGLVGANDGHISSSYSIGSITYIKAGEASAGGLAGYNFGTIKDSYSLTKVTDGRENDGAFGGLVGTNGQNGTITSSYGSGRTHRRHGGQAFLGGFVGEDQSEAGSLASCYWNLDRGIADPSQGAGNVPNDPGITGLTDAQLKSGLPDGFDPSIWASDPNINNGYPYLVANPPQ